MGLYEIAAFFYIYAVLGWCVEVAFAAIKESRFVNRGFLNGPICPIYGVGVVSVIFCLRRCSDNMILLYFASAILVTFIEWLTGYVMDRIFHQKWWDYSDQPLNIGGYVCLLFSLIWGAFCVFIIRCFHPVVKGIVAHVPMIAGGIILVILSAAMAADLYVTASAILKLNRRLEAMEKIAEDLRELADHMGENIYENVRDGKEKEERLKSRVAEVKEVRKELRAEYSAGKEEWYRNQQLRLDELKNRYNGLVDELETVNERLIKAFPNMQSRIHREALQELKKRAVLRRNKRKH